MRLIDADALKKEFGYTDEWYKSRTITTIIDNAPTVEEVEEPFITECRNTAIEKNLPLYFVYYKETGAFEVYITKTKELFEKRHYHNYLSTATFNAIVNRYLDDYFVYQCQTENTLEETENEKINR